MSTSQGACAGGGKGRNAGVFGRKPPSSPAPPPLPGSCLGTGFRDSVFRPPLLEMWLAHCTGLPRVAQSLLAGTVPAWLPDEGQVLWLLAVWAAPLSFVLLSASAKVILPPFPPPPRAFLKPDLGFPVPLPAVAPSCILLATAVCSYERDGAPVQHDFAGSSFTLCWFLLHPFGAL